MQLKIEKKSKKVKKKIGRKLTSPQANKQTNDEFLNMLATILPTNDRSKLLECYPKEEEEKESNKQTNREVK